MSLPPVAPLAFLTDSLCAELRDRCREAGYTEDVLAEIEGIAPGLFGRDVRPLIHHVLERRADAAAGLARLFAYEDTLDESLIRGVLGEPLVSALLEAGLLALDADSSPHHVRSRFQLRPFGGLWLLADDPTGGRDAVMPPAGTTRLVTQVMPAVISGSVLDVGCGPGSLALVAARRGAARVVGTDVNSRAVDLARFNARLNEIRDAEFLLGDLVEPVIGRRFELIVSQPPFIIQPPDAEAVTFLHGGPTGEEVGLRLLAVLPSVMGASARAMVLMEAVSRPDEPLHARMRAAMGDAPIDVLVLAAPGAPPALQVIAYATLEVPEGGPAYQAAARRYLQQLDRLSAADFQLGLIVMRSRPDGDSGRRKLAATVPVAALGRGDGAALERLLGGVDLAAQDDATLEQQGVTTSSFIRWIEERPCPDAQVEPTRSVRFRLGSFGSDLDLSQQRYAMAAVLDQAPTIHAATAAYATTLGQPVESVRHELLGFVREGLMRGLFEPRPINPIVTTD
jgi:SAM-dependent methyltransferase